MPMILITRSSIRQVLALLMLIITPSLAYALSSPSYSVVMDAVSSGGGSVSSASYLLSSLAGQPLTVGAVSSTGYTVQSGFYYIRLLEDLLAKRNSCLLHDGTALYAGFDGAGIWKSTDNGANWSPASTQPTNSYIRGLAVNPPLPTTLYAATYGGGLYQSTDSGDHWSVCTGQPTNLNATSLAVDPAGILYTGTEGGIFTSSDCISWSSVNTGLTVDAAKPPLVIVIDGSNLYAGFDGLGVWKKVGTGDWTAASTNLPANSRVKALVMKDSTNLYTAVYGSGVFKSGDSGGSWNACTSQPTDKNLLSLEIDGSGYLYAGTEAGVFVSSDDCTTWNPMNSGLPN